MVELYWFSSGQVHAAESGTLPERLFQPRIPCNGQGQVNGSLPLIAAETKNLFVTHTTNVYTIYSDANTEMTNTQCNAGDPLETP